MTIRHIRRGLLALLCAAAGVTALAPPVHAHGQPAELAFWGGFPPDVARCQRAIARATALCIGQVAGLRASCNAGAVQGNTCDQTALDARVGAARELARNRVLRSCTTTQLQGLNYLSESDALTDVINACRQLDTAATSAAFAPAMVGGTVASIGDPSASCVQAGAREATRLLRFGMRTYETALDRIAGVANMEPAQKQRLIDWARRRIAQTQALSRGALTTACGAENFTETYGRSVDTFLNGIAAQAACMQQFVYVQDAVRCPLPSCGNGMQEPGEECDDGNRFDGDGCRADCVKTDCAAYANTLDLVQHAIFENHGCTADACHGGAQSGGLDLRAGAASQNLIDVHSSLDPARKRVEPGDPQRSILYLKLAAKTLPDEYPADTLGIGTPMPSGLPALSQDELEALRLWIFSAAPTTGTVKGVGDLLHGCSPEPQPIQIKPLEPLPSGEGVQLHMPKWIVDAQSEHEVCFASYFDLTDQVPAEMRGPGGTTFCYKNDQLRQDPLSHHLIVNLYIGQYGPDDPGWGEFHCVGGTREGELCKATELGACGPGGECATAPQVRVGCSGFGPPDQGVNAVQFAGAQQTNATETFPDGVYRCVPLKGMIMWNSHAFNLTDRPGKLEAWLNFAFAKPAERQHFAAGIFDTSAIFNMTVAACTQEEVCNHHEMPANAKLFDLTSHMHQRGKRFRTFLGEFSCEGEKDFRGLPVACDPLDPTQCDPGVACTNPDGADPEHSLLYTNFVYNDPVDLRFDPPMTFTGTAQQRTLTYCALYDNGFTDPAKVKKKSTSPPTPWGTSTCPQATHCTAGRVCQPCTGKTDDERNHSCDTSDGANDGVCDACTLRGGVTTEDEMFLLLGAFFQ